MLESIAMDNSMTFSIESISQNNNISDLISICAKRKDESNRQFKNRKKNDISSPLPTSQENQGKEQDLSAKTELSSMHMGDFITSDLSQISNQDRDNKNLEATNYDTISLLEDSMKVRREDSKYLTPKLPEITLNDGSDLKKKSPPHFTSLSPANTLQYVESKEDENRTFMRDAQSPRSGSPAGSPGSPAASVYHDALGDKEEYWKLTGGSLVEAGLGINLGQKHDESTKRLQHDMLVRAQESNAKLQKELGECQKKGSMVDEQRAAEDRRKMTEWQVSKEQYYKEEIQMVKDEYASELKAQKESIQKALKLEIDREKAQLVQEFNSRISQEVTKACKKQELHIRQLNRTNRNLLEEKQGQEMDMEAYREKIASQEEDLLIANRRVPELMQSLDERNREVERLNARIGNLEKMSTEAQSHAERTRKELQKANQDLEATRKKVDYAIDSISDAESASGSGIRPWGSSRCTSKSKNQELKLKVLSEQLAEGKAVIESQSFQMILLREESLDLARAHEEDDATIKNQRRKIQSLEALPRRLFALSESFDNLKDEFLNLSRVEEQGKAIIKQLKNEINGFAATREELEKTQKSLIAKETDLNKTKIKLQHNEAVIKQQQKEIEGLTKTRTKLKEVQESLAAKQTDLNEVMIKLQHNESIIKQQQKEIDGLMKTRTKLKEVQDSLAAKQTDLNETIIKLGHDESVIKQQQKEINEYVVTRAKLKQVQESLDAKQTDLNETRIKLQQDEAIIKQQRKQIHQLVAAMAKLKELQRALNAKQTGLEKTMKELEEVNHELQRLRRVHQGKLEEPIQSNQERSTEVDGSMNSERNAGASSSCADKRSALPNDGEPARLLLTPNNNNNNNKNNNSANSPPREIRLSGAEDISEEIKKDNYDEGNESLHSLLQRAVAGGAAILRKLEMSPSGCNCSQFAGRIRKIAKGRILM